MPQKLKPIGNRNHSIVNAPGAVIDSSLEYP